MRGKHVFWLVPRARVSLPTTLSGGSGTRVARVERKARLEDRSRTKCAEGCGRPAKLLASLQLPAGGRGGLDAETSMGQITELVLCPNKEPFSLVAPSTPKRGRGQPRNPDLSASGSQKRSFKHPSKNLKLPGHCRQDRPWSKSSK